MGLLGQFLGVAALNEKDANDRQRLNHESDINRKNIAIREQDEEITRLRGQANAIPPKSQKEVSLQREVDMYRNLLSKPMLEIAEKNGEFKKTYEQQQAMLSEWFLKQEAFKKIAIELGEKLGKSEAEILNEADQLEDVLKEDKLSKEDRERLDKVEKEKIEKARLAQEIKDFIKEDIKQQELKIKNQAK